MKTRPLPEIPSSALRNHASSARVRAVWQRLEADLSGRRPARRSAWAWAPALALALFGSGVFVGARFVQAPIVARVQAEPPARVERPSAAAAPQPTSQTEASAPQDKTERRHVRRGLAVGALVVEASEPQAESAPYSSTPFVPAAPAGPPEWQRLAEAGDFAAARRALSAQGGFEAAMAVASPSELMSLVDVARAAGERERATRALQQVLAHPQAPEAPLAAWTLGNLLEQAGDTQGAADAFALYRRLSPTGDFAEDAAARQIDAALAQGNLELVSELVEDYAQNFPRGRRLAEFRRATSALSEAHQHDGGASADELHGDPDDETDDTASAASPAPSAAPAPASKP
ncbi:MAG TPA: hypothetical protein VGI10_22900 [Polyangiaceae bacterium]